MKRGDKVEVSVTGVIKDIYPAENGVKEGYLVEFDNELGFSLLTLPALVQKEKGK